MCVCVCVCVCVQDAIDDSPESIYLHQLPAGELPPLPSSFDVQLPEEPAPEEEVVEEGEPDTANWVQCTRCQAWRVVPDEFWPDIEASQEEDWFCEVRGCAHTYTHRRTHTPRSSHSLLVTDLSGEMPGRRQSHIQTPGMVAAACFLPLHCLLTPVFNCGTPCGTPGKSVLDCVCVCVTVRRRLPGTSHSSTPSPRRARSSRSEAATGPAAVSLTAVLPQHANCTCTCMLQPRSTA